MWKRLHAWVAVGFFAFLLHFPWEQLQAPLFSHLADREHWDGTLLCLRATMGDVAITWIAYAFVSLVSGSASWLIQPDKVRIMTFLFAGLAVTVVVEVVSVYALERWTYSELMPVVAGVGLAPLVQWIILPPLTVLLARRLVVTRESPSPNLC